MIRVLIADDHQLIRTGIEQLLSGCEDVEVVGTAQTGVEAVSAAAELEPDVILMDMQMPALDGVEAARQIAHAHPQTQIVMLTGFSDRRRILDALDAGAIGYLLKDSEPEDVIAGVRAAASGGSPLDPRAARTLVTRLVEHEPADVLTLRERQVIVLIAQGLANKQIARELEISEKTVKAHLTSAYRRIDVYDRTQAALWAERSGLLETRP